MMPVNGSRKRNRPKIGSLGFDWHPLVEDISHSDANLHRQVERAKHALLQEGIDDEQRLRLIFDPTLNDLSKLEIGLFRKKALTLPNSMVPERRDDLLRLCRQMIDKGEDEAHIKNMIMGFRPGVDLDTHVDSLIEIRSISEELYRRIVQGFHGEATIIFKKSVITGVTESEFKSLLMHQGLIWSAMDVQMVAAGARVTSIRPFSWLLRGRMKEPKGATVLRLMRGGLVALKYVLPLYNTAGATKRTNKSEQTPTNALGRLLWRIAERQLVSRDPSSGAIIGNRKGLLRTLDRAVEYARAHLVALETMIGDLETANLEGGATSNNQRTFHQIRNSNLSAVAGTAVALVRFASAEQSIGALVDQAFGDIGNPGVAVVQPLAPPDPVLPPLSKSLRRVLDLLYTARRAQLRDSDFLSKTKAQDQAPERDEADLAGLGPIKTAYAFLERVGQRYRYAGSWAADVDRAQQTYLYLDVVPEARLNLLHTPTPHMIC